MVGILRLVPHSSVAALAVLLQCVETVFAPMSEPLVKSEWRISAHGNGTLYPNVKEHATLSEGAHADHGVEVGITVEHVNRAADRGCCVSAYSSSYFRMASTSFVNCSRSFGSKSDASSLVPRPS